MKNDVARKQFIRVSYYFVKNWEGYLDQLCSATTKVLHAIESHINHQECSPVRGYAWPSYETIMNLMMIRKSTVAKSLRILQYYGFIEVIKWRKPQGSINAYKVASVCPEQPEHVGKCYEKFRKGEKFMPNSKEMDTIIKKHLENVKKSRKEKKGGQLIIKSTNEKNKSKSNWLSNIANHWVGQYYITLNQNYIPTIAERSIFSDVYKKKCSDALLFNEAITWYLKNYSLLKGHKNTPNIKAFSYWKHDIFLYASGKMKTPVKSLGQYRKDKERPMLRVKM